MKTCSKCHETKPFDGFTPTKDKRLKVQTLQSWCKACMAAKAKAWQDANKDRAYAAQKSWRQANRTQWNGWMAAATKKRQAAKLQRIPTWYDDDLVKEVYALALEFREAGFQVDVDHLVPLQGDTVSGLHWHGNLRVCLASVNRSKGNRLLDACSSPGLKSI
jgi:hypothetical protein